MGSENPKSVEDFRSILTNETHNLNRLCDQWNKILEQESTIENPEEENQIVSEREDFLGAIRSTIGQAKLLMSQRFKQFTDLINHCESNTGQHLTTLNDLSGFWEMISFQVSDVKHKFKSLDDTQSRLTSGELSANS